MSKQDESINFLENINGLYGGNTYLEKNGMSVIVAGVILTIVFSIITYSEISSHLNVIKQDWPTNRCKPQYLPLAGFINAPPGESKWAYTAKNFSFCINDILSEIAGFVTNPAKMMTSIVAEALSVVNAIMAKLSGFISTIRTDIMNFAQDVVARVLNLLVPIIESWHKLYDIIKRTTGVLGFIFYFVDLVFFSILSWVNLVVKVITDWVLFVFEVMGVTGLILSLPLMALIIIIIINLLILFSGLVIELLSVPVTAIFFPAGAAMFAVGEGITAGSTIPLITTTGTFLTVAGISLAAVIAILVVMEIYIALIVDPMQDFLGLFPGFIETPSDKNPSDILWWVNALDITKDLVTPMKFDKTSDAKDRQKSEAALKSGKGSPSGMSITGEMSKGKKESFRNMFY